MLSAMPVAFDTLSAAKRLADAGIDRDHAEAIAETAREAMDATCGDLVTKKDLKAGLAAQDARLTWRMVVIVFGMGGLLFAALRLIP